jgi:hypothetical protein
MFTSPKTNSWFVVSPLMIFIRLDTTVTTNQWQGIPPIRGGNDGRNAPQPLRRTSTSSTRLIVLLLLSPRQISSRRIRVHFFQDQTHAPWPPHPRSCPAMLQRRLLPRGPLRRKCLVVPLMNPTSLPDGLATQYGVCLHSSSGL